MSHEPYILHSALHIYTNTHVPWPIIQFLFQNHGKKCGINRGKLFDFEIGSEYED